MQLITLRDPLSDRKLKKGHHYHRRKFVPLLSVKLRLIPYQRYVTCLYCSIQACHIPLESFRSDIEVNVIIICVPLLLGQRLHMVYHHRHNDVKVLWFTQNGCHVNSAKVKTVKHKSRQHKSRQQNTSQDNQAQVKTAKHKSTHTSTSQDVQAQVMTYKYKTYKHKS